MSFELSALSALTPVAPLDLSAGVNGASNEIRIKQVSKAMESLFVSQLTQEMGKGIDSTSESQDSGSQEEGGPYSDFINQAMTQGVTQGGGFGLAKIIENSLTHHNQAAAPHTQLKPNNTSYHVNRAE